MDGRRYRGDHVHQPDSHGPRLASTRPQRPCTGRRHSDARPARPGPRLVRRRRPRLHAGRALASPRRGSLQAWRDGRGDQHHGSDAGGASPAGPDRRRRRCTMMLDYVTYMLLAIIVIVFFSSAIRILREYERGIVFTLGRFTGVKGPGLIILIPFVQQMVKA